MVEAEERDVRHEKREVQYKLRGHIMDTTG